MADTNFIAGQQIPLAWIQDVNNAVYRGLGVGGVVPTTLAQTLANIGAAALQGSAAVQFSVAAATGANQATTLSQVQALIAAAIPTSGVTSFNTRTGAVTLTSADVTGALGYTPASSASGVSSFNTRTGAVTLTGGDVMGALGFIPLGPTTAFNQPLTGQVLESAGARVNRVADRLFVGNAILNDGNHTSPNADPAEQVRTPSTNLATFASEALGNGVAVLGFSASAGDTIPDDMGCIGIYGLVNNNNSTNPVSAYAGYFEARAQTGSKYTLGIEIDIVQMNSGAPQINPSAIVQSGMGVALWLASGGGVTGAQPASAAIGIINNRATFQSGIVFGSGSLAPDSDSLYDAVVMPPNYHVMWRNSSDAVVGTVFSDGTNMHLLAPNGTISFDVSASATPTSGVSAGTAQALPSQPEGYLRILLNGTTAVAIPFYVHA